MNSDTSSQTSTSSQSTSAGLAFSTGVHASQPHQPAARPSVLSLVIKERAGLYAAYMPFIEGGGLFIPTQKEYHMGDMVYIILQLMTNPKKYSISAKVVWMSPGGMSQRIKGIGVQIPIDAAGLELRQFIEQSLGTALGSSRKTHTL